MGRSEKCRVYYNTEIGRQRGGVLSEYAAANRHDYRRKHRHTLKPSFKGRL